MTTAPPITFPDGLVGFAGPQRFTLMPWGGDDSPFLLLQSLDEEQLSFVVVPPHVFFPTYEPELDDDAAGSIELDDAADALLLVIVNCTGDVRDATANLLGPLVVNTKTLDAVQAVVDPDRWQSRHRLLAPAATNAA